MGSIDVLVNNAGIETIIPFLEMTDEQWQKATVVNLKSGWLLLRSLLPPRNTGKTAGCNHQYRLHSGCARAAGQDALCAQQAGH